MEFYGILGEKLGHSLSPRIHKMIFETIGIEGAYKLFEVPQDSLNKFAESMKILKINGANVTIPYKEKIMPYLDVISEEAKAIGAVNTIALKDNKLYGYNTDYYGFGYMLDLHKVSVTGKKTLVLGSGGAAKAVVEYLINNNASSICVVSRNKIHQGIHGDKVRYITYEDVEAEMGDILINCTPVGMFPNDEECPVSDTVISNFDTIVDIIYNPTETELMLRAEAMGKRVVGGLYMLIGQGVRAEELWQDVIIDESIIKDIYEVLNREFS